MKFRANRAACVMLAVMSATALTGCGGGSMFGSSSGTSSSSSMGSRFSQLFGSNSQAAQTSDTPAAPSTQATDNSDLTCPNVQIRYGASTLAVGLPGKQASGNDLRYQGTIVRTARDCTLQGGKQISARIGIQGRVIVGPAGAPPTVDIPIRVAVVQDGAPEKIITTKAYKTSVSIPPDELNADFSLVAEDIVYPVPTAEANDKYIFYIGFDPAGLKPEAPAKGKKKK